MVVRGRNPSGSRPPCRAVPTQPWSTGSAPRRIPAGRLARTGRGWRLSAYEILRARHDVPNRGGRIEMVKGMAPGLIVQETANRHAYSHCRTNAAVVVVLMVFEEAHRYSGTEELYKRQLVIAMQPFQGEEPCLPNCCTGR